MRNFISARLAGNILLISLALLAVFHVLVLLRVVPADSVWGGQIGDSPANLLLLETIALLLTLLFALIIAARVGYIKTVRFQRATTVALWIIFAFLVLNTLGNLASGSNTERLIFTPITLILAFCAFRLASGTRKNS